MMSAHHASDVASHRAGDGGNKARSPGRARRKPLKPLRRECRREAAHLWRLHSCAFYFAHGAMGAARTRHSPRPLRCGGTLLMQNLGRAVLREDEPVAHPSRRGLSAAPQDEVPMCCTMSDPHGEERDNVARLEPCGRTLTCLALAL